MDAFDDQPTTIIVKNVYDIDEQIELSVSTKTTIGEVKSMLCSKLASHPDVKYQRLIYGGKVCEDAMVLSNLFNKMDLTSTQTFQLLISKPGVATVKQPSLVTAKAHPSATLRDRSAVPTDVNSNATSSGSAQESSNPIAASAPSQAPTSAAQSQPSHAFEGGYQQSTLPNTQYTQQMNENMNPYFMQQMIYNHNMMMMHALYQQQLAAHFQQQQHPQAQHAQPYMYSTAYPAFHQPMFQASQMPQVLPGAPIIQGASSTPAATSANAGATPANMNGAANRAAALQAMEGYMAFVDVKLAIKLVVLVFVIGQDGSSSRFWYICAAAVAAYLYLSGIFSRLLGYLNSRRTTPQPLGAQNAQANQGPNAAPGQAQPTHQQHASNFIRSLGISPEGGYIRDLLYFFVGFFLSLVPSWRPIPTPIVAAAPPNAPNGM